MEPKPHILVVDDDPDFVVAHQLALERAGYSVDTASNGTEALSRLARGGVDLVVLDVMMDYPTEGFDVCDVMRKNPGMQAIPILMVSSVDWNETAQRSQPAGPNCLLPGDFIRKPIPQTEFIERVRGLLVRHGKAK